MQISDLTIISFCDLAGSKKGRERLKRTSARSAIVTIGVDDLTRIFVLNAWAARCTTDELTERVFKINDDLHPKIFGVEANAMQSLFVDALMREARRTGRRVPLVPVTQDTHIDKNWRIRTALQPVLGEGRLFLQDNQSELRAELATFPMSPTVDIVDALASAVMLAPRRAPHVVKRDDTEALAKYLRDSGVPPKTILERLGPTINGRRPWWERQQQFP